MIFSINRPIQTVFPTISLYDRWETNTEFRILLIIPSYIGVCSWAVVFYDLISVRQGVVLWKLSPYPRSSTDSQGFKLLLKSGYLNFFSPWLTWSEHSDTGVQTWRKELSVGQSSWTRRVTCGKAGNNYCSQWAWSPITYAAIITVTTLDGKWGVLRSDSVLQATWWFFVDLDVWRVMEFLWMLISALVSTAVWLHLKKDWKLSPVAPLPTTKHTTGTSIWNEIVWMHNVQEEWEMYHCSQSHRVSFQGHTFFVSLGTVLGP